MQTTRFLTLFISIYRPQNSQHIMDLDDETFNTNATEPAVMNGGDFVPHPAAHYDARYNHIG